MNDQQKTKKQLIDELNFLRQKVAAIEKNGNDFSHLSSEFTVTDQSLVLDCMNEMFARYNTKLEIQWINKASAVSVNMTHEEMIGKHCYKIWHGRSTPCENCPVIKAMQTGTAQEIEKATPDGRIWFLRGYPVFDNNGNLTGAFEFGLDITERITVEKALAQERFLIEAFMENIPDAIYFKNRNGQFIRINEAQASRFGLKTKDEALGKTDFDFFKKEDAEDLLIEDQNVMNSGKSYSIERKKRFLNGREGWASTIKIPLKNEQDEIIGLFGLTRDITQQKNAEKALKISENSLRRAQGIAHFGNWDWNIVDEKLVWSDELYCIFGVDKDVFKLSFENIENLIHDEDKPYNEQMVDRLMNEEKALEYTMRIVRPDGNIRYTKQHIEVERDSTGNAIKAFGTIADITDLKEIEEQLRKEKEIAQKYLDIAAVIFVALDSDGNIRMINKKGVELLGYNSEDELIGVPWFKNFIMENSRDKVFADFKKIISGDIKSFDYYEEPLMGRDKKVHIIAWYNSLIKDERGNIIGTLSSGEDITKRKKAELALKENKDRLQAILEASPAAIILLDLEAKVELWNPAAEKMFGWKSEEVMGKFLPIVAENDFKHFQKIFTKYLNGEKGYYEEIGPVRKDGKYLDTLLSAAPLYNSQGNVQSLIGILTDISVLKKVQFEKQSLEEQLLQSQKLEAIGRLAGGVAHDFNNMLTAIIGNADLLLSDIFDKDLMLEDVDEIKKAAERASDLTRQLLAFSRKQPLKMDILDLTTVIADIKKMLQRLIGEDIELIADLASDLKRAKADRGQIEQVIINLAVNAKDAMPAGGSIRIHTGNEIVDKSILDKYDHVDSNEFVTITFTDDGPGMSANVKARIFEPFFSTKEKGKGTGLGLAVVYGIIRQHEGWIDVRSEPDKGTEFKIYLPVFNTTKMKKIKSSRISKDFHGSGKRVLLVEDEETVRKFALRALQEKGYEVFDANNSEQALNIFKKEGGNFDLIFSDVVLPDESGIAMIEKLLNKGSHFQILLSSGYSDEKSQWQLIQKRGYNFIQKPYTIEELLDKIETITDHH
ncbi:PAS domain S-box protein [candidate division KSB1 bacterium]|nr:PAS domain S-box protein [candidate division KSB1 bacterium]